MTLGSYSFICTLRYPPALSLPYRFISRSTLSACSSLLTFLLFHRKLDFANSFLFRVSSEYILYFHSTSAWNTCFVTQHHLVTISQCTALFHADCTITAEWLIFSSTHCCLGRHIATKDLVKIGSDKTTLPDGPKPLSEPMLTNNLWCLVNVHWNQFLCTSLRYPTLIWLWKLLTGFSDYTDLFWWNNIKK